MSGNERDELALTLANAQRVRNGSPKLPSAEQCSRLAFDDADALLAAGYRKPRTITTVKELDALELRTVVHDSDGEPFELTDNGWRYWMYEESFSSLELSLPATVLHEPEATL